jgi:hypothetical protein
VHVQMVLVRVVYVQMIHTQVINVQVVHVLVVTCMCSICRLYKDSNGTWAGWSNSDCTRSWRSTRQTGALRDVLFKSNCVQVDHVQVVNVQVVRF